MPRTAKAVNMRLISKISSMYYERRYTQQEIADRLRLSRVKVSRMLKQAHKAGIVRISVVSPEDAFMDLERKLEERYRLKEVLLCDSDENESGRVVRQRLGTLAADYLLRTVADGDMIGVSWGSTLQAMLDEMLPRPVPNVHIVQTLGGVGAAEAKAHAADIARRLSHMLGGKLTLLQTPGIPGSLRAKKVLMEDRQVQSAFGLFPKINTLYVGMGSLLTNPLFAEADSGLPPEYLQKIRDAGAVGDMAMYFLDQHGQVINTPLHQLIMGISPEEIRKLPSVVGVSGGPDKLEIIQSVLRGGFLKVLISDRQTAESLLKNPVP